MKLDFI